MLNVKKEKKRKEKEKERKRKNKKVRDSRKCICNITMNKTFGKFDDIKKLTLSKTLKAKWLVGK